MNQLQITHRQHISRRDWLRLGLALIAALSLRPAHASSRRQYTVADIERLLRLGNSWLYGDCANLRNLGRMYLASHPEFERELRVLPDRSTKLARAIAQDWDRHDVAIVDGWVMSLTEARLCASLHLCSDPDA